MIRLIEAYNNGRSFNIYAEVVWAINKAKALVDQKRVLDPSIPEFKVSKKQINDLVFSLEVAFERYLKEHNKIGIDQDFPSIIYTKKVNYLGSDTANLLSMEEIEELEKFLGINAEVEKSVADDKDLDLITAEKLKDLEESLGINKLDIQKSVIENKDNNRNLNRQKSLSTQEEISLKRKYDNSEKENLDNSENKMEEVLNNSSSNSKSDDSKLLNTSKKFKNHENRGGLSGNFKLAEFNRSSSDTYRG